MKKVLFSMFTLLIIFGLGNSKQAFAEELDTDDFHPDTEIFMERVNDYIDSLNDEELNDLDMDVVMSFGEDLDMDVVHENETDFIGMKSDPTEIGVQNVFTGTGGYVELWFNRSNRNISYSISQNTLRPFLFNGNLTVWRGTVTGGSVFQSHRLQHNVTLGWSPSGSYRLNNTAATVFTAQLTGVGITPLHNGVTVFRVHPNAAIPIRL